MPVDERISKWDKALAQGAGPIRTLCMMTAKAMGAAQAVITDLDQGRLAPAKTLGADHVVCVRGMSVLDVQDAVLDCLHCEPDATIECTGVQACMESPILTTLSGGVIVMAGLRAPRNDLPLIDSCLREVDIRGVFRYANCYPTALNLIASRRIDLTGLTRAYYKLQEAEEAFQRAQMTTLSGGVIVMIGLGAPRNDLPLMDSCLRDVDIRGFFRYANCYTTASNLIASRRIDSTGLTRAHYKLQEAQEAFQRAQMADVMKVFIQCHE